MTWEETDNETDSMRIPSLAVALLMLALAPVSAQSLDSLFAGSDVRRSQMFGGDDIRSDVWSFLKDGTYSGPFFIERLMWSDGGYIEEGSSSGRWRIEGKRLCLSETPDGRRGEICFLMERTGGTTLHSEFTGTEVGTDRRWMFHVAPGG